MLMFTHESGTPYSKEENAIAERAIGEVMRHLQALFWDKRTHTQWSFEQLPLVQRIFNAQVHSSTGVSPAELLYGNAIDLNRRLITPPKHIEAKNLSDYMARMIKAQSNLLKLAQATQQAKDDAHIQTQNVLFPTEFPINSWVIVSHPAGRRTKFETNKTGPFLVVNIVGSTYTLQDTLTGKNFDLNVSTLTPFEFDPDRTNPREVRIQDSGEFYVDSILEHRGSRQRPSTMEFLVHWKGYGPEHDTWEPINKLRDNTIFHTYCIEHSMRTFIPSEHKASAKAANRL
jgi:hypothetical protein